jgi:hypothetical protein
MLVQLSKALPLGFPGRRFAVILWGVVVLSVLVTLLPNAAQACPKQHAGSGITGAVTIAPKAAHQSTVKAVSAARVGAATRGHCCERCGHGGNGACKSGCCAACTAAIDIVAAGVELPDTPRSHGLPIPGKVISSIPPPDFKPPRSFA